MPAHAYSTVVSRRDQLIAYVGSQGATPFSTYAPFFSRVLLSLSDTVPSVKDAKKQVFRVLREMVCGIGGSYTKYMVRQTYKNLRRAFYILLFMPVEELPPLLHCASAYDPTPYLVKWRLAEGI